MKTVEKEPAVYEIQIKQRGGKWAPQFQRHAAEALEAWEHMFHMKRRLRMVRLAPDGTRVVIAKHEPPIEPPAALRISLQDALKRSLK